MGRPKGSKDRLETKEEFLKRFESKVDKNSASGCWLWTASTFGGNRYGSFSIKGIDYSAHRVSYELYVGVDPGKLNVLHECDNGLCVNPNHLFLGTHKENMEDRGKKGRGNNPKGISHWNSKLNNKKILEIRSKYKKCKNGHDKDCYGINKLSREYGVNPSTIHEILQNKIWKDL